MGHFLIKQAKVREMKEKRILRFLDKIRLEMSWIAYSQCSLCKCAKIEMTKMLEIRKVFSDI